jgi:hypothetical protein
VAALSLLSGVIAAGHRYFHCSMMGSVGFVACCDHDAGEREPAIDADACCHPREFASPDRGFASPPPDVAPSPFVALAHTPMLERAALTSPRLVDLRSARAGPARGSPRDYRIRLSVSVI